MEESETLQMLKLRDGKVPVARGLLPFFTLNSNAYVCKLQHGHVLNDMICKRNNSSVNVFNLIFVSESNGEHNSFKENRWRRLQSPMKLYPGNWPCVNSRVETFGRVKHGSR
jgi:hypothetical protein